MKKYKARHLSVNQKDELVVTYFEIEAGNYKDLKEKALNEVFVREEVHHHEKGDFAIEDDSDLENGVPLMLMWIENGNAEIVLEVLVGDFAMFEDVMMPDGVQNEQ